MKFYFLDAGGAGLAYFFVGLLIGFMILCILAEAGVMIAMKYNRSFKKTFLDALLVNIASLVIGFILIEYAGSFFNSYEAPVLLILYAVTVLVEFGLLYLLNKKHPLRSTFIVSLVMNIPTYIILYLIGNN
ncbi:MAG: hypothetical protein H7Y01_06430 [Ferruginibacter sp.]|nr:hypothetical protein [Chitinophagaceae bacterium]